MTALSFNRRKDWERWLDKHHGDPEGVWLRMAKKASGELSLSHPEALEIALCYGWIDGRRKSECDTHFLQWFAPRAQRSLWSKINREKALALIESGRMQPAGLREVERAKADGRWDRAYEPQRNASVPEDFKAALERTPQALAFFKTLDSRNRYACLFRLQTIKRAETRARRIELYVAMLARGEKLHP